MFAVSYVLFLAICNAIGVGTATYLVALIVAGSFTYASVKLKQNQFTDQWSKAHLTASPEGITSYER